jgi:hypothetical protein
MCDACFNSEILSFPSTEDYQDFDLALTQKIANDKSMRMGQYVNTAWKDIGYQVYECLGCGQLWRLSNSENPGGRQFSRKTKEKENTNPSYFQSKSLRLLIGALVIIVFVIVIVWWVL